MMGRTHALSGSTAFAALAFAAPMVGVHAHWGAISAGLLSTAGAALLPDLDHPDATCAHVFGFVSKALARFVHRVSGGHRHATHSFAFMAAMPLLTWAGDVMLGNWFALSLMFVLFAFGLRALHLARGLAPALAFALTLVVASTMLRDFGWLPYSVGVGIAAHLAGDCLTKEGCPLLWPRRTHYMLPIVRRTGNAVERRIFAPLFMAGTIALLVLGR